jgi:hypothetical protein
LIVDNGTGFSGFSGDALFAIKPFATSHSGQRQNSNRNLKLHKIPPMRQ